MAMKSKIVVGALTALLYSQGLLGVAGVATVLLRDRADATHPVLKADAVQTGLVAANL